MSNLHLNMLKQNQVDVVILDDMFSKRYGLVTLKPFIKTQPKICLNQKVLCDLESRKLALACLLILLYIKRTFLYIL